MDNEQFSAYRVSEGENITVNMELKSVVNRNITINPVPILQSPRGLYMDVFDNHTMYLARPDIWQVVSMSEREITLAPGETRQFNYTIKALKTGVYHIDTAFTGPGILDTGISFGRGSTILVLPPDGVMPHYNLETHSQRFNITYLIEPPYRIADVALDENQKSLLIEIAGGSNDLDSTAASNESYNNHTDMKAMAIWIPKDVIRNYVYQEGGGAYRDIALEVAIDGRNLEHDEDYDYIRSLNQYLLYLPPDVSKITMHGTVVVPEFGALVAAVAAVAVSSAVIVTRRLKG